nr:mannose-1-phosphate guanylyltransferase/mannose-6-phosphate isomerase [Helicobacter pametensis]
MKILILCGGSGTRLWPLSRTMLPKQFAPLFPDETLFQKTLKRSFELLESLQIEGQVEVITNINHYFLAQEQSQTYGKVETFLLEDSPRDSAAALILGALSASAKDIILALPSDHLIGDFEAFAMNVKEAIYKAQEGKIITFGISPSSAHTGYGYIHSKNSSVLGFHEKPDQHKAEEFLRSGEYYWNSGMFCFEVQTFLAECQIHAQELLEKSQKILAQSNKEHNFIWLKGMEEIPKISIDYALMEKTQKIAMVASTFAWNDVGSFDSLLTEFECDQNGNSSSQELTCKDSKDNFILASKPTALIGINSLAIIETKDALLISQKGRTQEVKEIVQKLEGKEILNTHSLVYRPWGSYEVLEEGQFYKIKKIIVKPQKRLSLQKHFHRNEHWIVISGSAYVQIGEKEIFLQSNESTYIPMGMPHRLSNQGKLDLVMIEVQVGEYVGEDDIIRLEDDFHRA